MRPVGGTKGNLRGSALWGKKTKGEARSSALWGKPGRRAAALLAVVGILAAPVAAPASNGNGASSGALVPNALLANAQAHPGGKFRVIVQARPGKSSTYVASLVKGVVSKHPGKSRGLKKKFSAVNGASAQLTGAQLVALAKQKGILAITRDRRLVATGQFSNDQTWVQTAGVDDFWVGQALSGLGMPAIAIVDSGVQTGRLDFSGRLLKQVRLTSLAPNSLGDGRGHGTFVAGIAAGAAAKYAGAAPTAPIVSLDVMDDNGMALTSDVIAAADWILQNKAAYNIRVANFSLQSSTPATFTYDPLDQRSRSSGSPASWWLPPPATTATTASRRRSVTRPATIPSSSRSAPQIRTERRGARQTTSQLPGRPTGTRSTASPSLTSAHLDACSWARSRRCRRWLVSTPSD